MSRTLPSSVLLFAALVALVQPARAHDNWLELEPFGAPSAKRIKTYLFRGEQLEEAEPFPIRRSDKYPRFRVLTAQGVRDLLGELREDQQPFTSWSVPAAAGTVVFALDAAPRDIELDAKHFQEYLLEERLVDVLVWRAGTNEEDSPGRERYSRSLKAMAQIGSRLDPLATRPVGQELEVVPLTHPYALTLGSTLTVQVLFQGKPLAGRAVVAANRFHGSVVKKTFRTDAKGLASFPIARPGDWMLRLVHMERTSGSVDWRSYWTSLTFALPDATPSASK